MTQTILVFQAVSKSFFTALNYQLKIWTHSWTVYQTNSWPGRHPDLQGQKTLVTQCTEYHFAAQQVSW